MISTGHAQSWQHAEHVTCEGDSSREAEDSLLSLLWLWGDGQGLTMLPLEGQGVLLQLTQRNGGGTRRERSACCRGAHTHAHTHTHTRTQTHIHTKVKSKYERIMQFEKELIRSFHMEFIVTVSCLQHSVAQHFGSTLGWKDTFSFF